MGVRSRTCSAIVLLCVLAVPAHATSPQLEAYGRLPTLEDVALSPDGTKLAFVRTFEDSRILAVVAIAEQKMLGGARLGESKLRSIHWPDNDHLLIITSTTGMPTAVKRPRDSEPNPLAAGS
jgi:hypothetical protein